MMKLSVGPTTLSPRKLVSKLPVVFFLIFTLLTVWVQGVKLFGSGIFDHKGNLVYEGEVMFHDSNVHLSLISEMLVRFPPTNFSSTIDGIAPLKNYHYLYDALLALVVRISGLSIFDVYFRVAPVLISVLLSLSIYLVVLRLTKERLTASFAIFFTIFGTSFGSVLPYIKRFLGGNMVTGGSNIFMTDQLVDMLVNPHGGLSLVIFLVIALLLWEYESSRKGRYLVGYAFLLAVSFGVKAYGGLVFAFAAAAASIWILVRRQDFRPLLATTLGFLGMGIFIGATIGPGVAGIQWAPFWLLEKMMIEMDRVNEPRYLLLLQHYQEAGNWLRIALMYTTALAVYIVGSLGLRIFGLVALWGAVKKWREFSAGMVFFLGGALVSFVVPIIFNQTKKAYDIVQFTPYFTIAMGILFSVFAFWIVRKINGRFFQWLALSFLVLVFLLSNKSEMAVRLDGERSTRDLVVIPRGVVQAVDYIQNETPEGAIFLLAPSDYNFRFPWFTALTRRRTVYAGRGFAFQVGIDTKKAEQRVSDIFAGREKFDHFDYLFMTRTEGQQFARIRERYNFREEFANDEAVVWKKMP